MVPSDDWNDGRIYFNFGYGSLVPVEENKKDQTKEKVRDHYFEFTIGKKTLIEFKNVVKTSKKMDVAPFIKNDRTMLPLRYVAESIGAEVLWNNKTRTASFIKDGVRADIQIDGKTIVLSTGEKIESYAKPQNIDGRIFIPLTNISQVFNLTNGTVKDGVDNDIEWDGTNRKVLVYVK